MNLSTINNSKFRTLVLQSTAVAGGGTWGTVAGNTWTGFGLTNIAVNSESVMSNFVSGSTFTIKPGFYIATIEVAVYTNQTGVAFRLKNNTTGNLICQWTNTRIGSGNLASIAPQTAFRQTTGFTLTNETIAILEVLTGSAVSSAAVNDGDYQTFCQLTLDKIG